MYSVAGSSGMSLSGLPHSEIFGSKPVCGSPKLIAAYHVLHRLLAPRHSPYALSSLTIRTSELTPDRLQTPAPASGLEPELILKPAAYRRVSSSNAHCVCVVGKLPFAGYSVVKEPHRLRFTSRLADVHLRRVRTSARCRRRLAEPIRRSRARKRSWWRIPGSNR